MNKTEETIVISNENFEIEALVYIDEGKDKYAKINNAFVSIDILKFLGYEIREISPDI